MAKFRPPLWALIWLALVLLAGVILLANTAIVERLMDSTGLTAMLYPGGRSALPKVVHPAPEVPEAAIPEVVVPDITPLSPPEVVVPETSPVPPSASVVNEPPPLPATPNSYRLFFSRLGPDGRMEAVEVVRELPAGSTPLTATLRALLLGPTLQEKAQGAITLIPQGSKLLSARLKNSTAVLSFSEEFSHNTLGNEGLLGELKQVVWTATQFSTVNDVQFLIGGQYRDSLGEEGLSIAQPLGRSSLP
jgi:hypothetical protein